MSRLSNIAFFCTISSFKKGPDEATAGGGGGGGDLNDYLQKIKLK